MMTLLLQKHWYKQEMHRSSSKSAVSTLRSTPAPFSPPSPEMRFSTDVNDITTTVAASNSAETL